MTRTLVDGGGADGWKGEGKGDVCGEGLKAEIVRGGLLCYC